MLGQITVSYVVRQDLTRAVRPFQNTIEIEPIDRLLLAVTMHLLTGLNFVRGYNTVWKQELVKNIDKR